MPQNFINKHKVSPEAVSLRATCHYVQHLPFDEPGTHCNHLSQAEILLITFSATDFFYSAKCVSFSGTVTPSSLCEAIKHTSPVFATLMSHLQFTKKHLQITKHPRQ